MEAQVGTVQPEFSTDFSFQQFFLYQTAIHLFLSQELSFQHTDNCTFSCGRQFAPTYKPFIVTNDMLIIDDPLNMLGKFEQLPCKVSWGFLCGYPYFSMQKH